MNKEMMNTDSLRKIVSTKMPFGRFKGLMLIDLPETYVVWFHQNGFPEGDLGRLMAELYEIKVNGLEKLVKSMNL